MKELNFIKIDFYYQNYFILTNFKIHMLIFGEKKQHVYELEILFKK
jgi:hypothetical protein